MNSQEKVETVQMSKKEYTFADWFGKDLTGQTYKGDIDCRNAKLTSLRGSPQKVEGNFDCSWNKLTSLEGGPKIVSGGYNCSWNECTSLNGAPKK